MNTVLRKKLFKLLAVLNASVITFTVLSVNILPSKANGVPASITNFTAAKMDLASGGSNLIGNGDFEATPDTGTGWNITDFLNAGAVTVDTDSTDAYAGSGCVKFSESNAASPAMAVFWVTVSPNTDYMFSTWVKGPYLGADNSGDVTFGIVDPDSKQFILDQNPADGQTSNVNSSATESLTPPAWDNEWHQRGCVFNSGSLTKVGVAIVGKNGTAYFDNMVLCKDTDAYAPTPSDLNQFAKVTNKNPSLKGCAPEDNLIYDFTLSDSDSSFWTSGLSYGDTVSIQKDPQNASNSILAYSGAGTWADYIKWITVKPHTDYTFSADVKGVQKGGVIFGLMDSNSVCPQDIGSEMQPKWDKTWHVVSFSFNSGVYSKVAFYTSDGGGQIYFDNLRLFESTKGIQLTGSNAADNGNTAENPYTGSSNGLLPVVQCLLIFGSCLAVISLRSRKLQKVSH